jgi:hypothetical protein
VSQVEPPFLSMASFAACAFFISSGVDFGLFNTVVIESCACLALFLNS